MKKKSYFIALIYLAAASLCAAFAAVYEHFSHGVYSPFMVFAFLIPFIGGFIPSRKAAKQDPVQALRSE